MSDRTGDSSQKSAHRFNISKERCAELAKLEEGCEVGAGALAADPTVLGSTPNPDGTCAPAVQGICPVCNSSDVADNGECGQGCCDDYKCRACGNAWRFEWPD